MAFANPSYHFSRVVTPSDTVNFAEGVCDAIHVGVGGTITVVFQDLSTAQFTATTGQIIPVRAIRVNNTNTAATTMVAMYER